MQNKYILGGIVLVLILAGGFWYYSQNQNNSNSENNTTPETNVGNGDNTLPAEEEILAGGEVYVVDEDQSVLRWSAERIVGNSHSGTVPFTGRVIVDGDTFVNGVFEMDIANFTSDDNNERFMTHVKSEDFFEVEQYPTAQLLIKSVDQVNDNNYSVLADLTVKGQTNEISFPATIVREGEDIKAMAEFTIDRTRWGIVYDSGSIFSELGDRAIRDEIQFNLDLEVSPQTN